MSGCGESRRRASVSLYAQPEGFLRFGRWQRAGHRQVLVRVLATTVNGGELFGRAGKLKLFLDRGFPKRTGLDFVGDVVEVGASVTDLEEGQRVWGTVPEPVFGAAAEYVAVESGRVAIAPTNLTPMETVSLLAGGTTAITALRDHARIHNGESVLIRGAAGGVGSVAVQVAKLFGGRVTAMAGERSLDFVRGLGADDVVDYRSVQPEDLGTFDVVLDVRGGQQWRYRRLLGPDGRMVAIGLDADHVVLSFGYVALSTVHGSRRVRFFRGNPDRKLISELTAYAEDGSVRPVVDRVFELEQLADAHRTLEAGGVRGKLVITLD